MTRPTARVLALLEILQAGGTRTVADLAGRLGVDERTVRRYVAHLVDLDVPVESVRGRYGGIRLVPGYRMPPLMLTDDEALAVLLGLVSGRRAGLVSTSVAAAESAAAKLRRVLPQALGRRLDALLQTADFTVGPRPSAAPETAVLLLVAEAARDRRPVDIDYTDSTGRRSRRTVHPYGIVAHSGRWYLTGADSASGQVRTFRIDRIAAPQPSTGTFDVPAGFDPTDALLSAIAAAPHRHVVSLRVEGTAEQVRPLFPPGTATVEEEADDPGWVRVLIRAERLDWVPAVLAGIDRPFRVEGPQALRPLVRALVERLTAAVEADTGRGDQAPPGSPGVSSTRPRGRRGRQPSAGSGHESPPPPPR
ncbi:transcriptional regulator [Geodermatophilus sp. TF02-6]|uniref:helix-turn-helix transcriptional regulator n=1 Tax=Geodermatophilus sp. TF02-6 TaxID=2250575 RepID=UPI000DE9B7BC|nr:YafY family protein [Geodermatophilus sp. TF02-6]RBY80956.1 transcriptional regulator [Geodermatophilus sp. TF02-6]